MNTQDQSTTTNDEELVARLSIHVDAEGEIGYNCDWDASDSGLLGIAAVLYKLMLGDLSIKIFEEIKAQCVLDNNEQDFLAIEETIRKYSMLENNALKKDDDVVIPPDKITIL
mgnify:FL=1